MAFTSYLVVNCFILLIGIAFWVRTKMFSWELFWIGFAGSMINTIGIVCAQNAMAKGPMGPASSISNTNFIVFTGVQILFF